VLGDRNKTVADNYGVRLIAYEGGQHFVGIQVAERRGINDVRRPELRSRMTTSRPRRLEDRGGQDFAPVTAAAGQVGLLGARGVLRPGPK
jgi:hypothetical protein